MKRSGLALLLLVLGALGSAEVRQGIKPRSDSSDYPAHVKRPGVTVGAALLSPDQVRNMFASDLSRYTVVEVALQPNDGITLDVAASDFALRIANTQNTARPANPRAIAAILHKDAAKGGVDVYPSVGVGYESGPRGYDPATGTVRGGGVRTSVGVGVGVGGPHAASTDQDRRTMELELSEKGLPEGATSKPVAGYLYFPLVAKKKGAAYELDYESSGSKSRLHLPPAPGK